jgi:ComF family protein
VGCAAEKGIERGITLGDYDEEALRAWILAYKHGGRVDLARVLGPLLRAALGDEGASGTTEVLVPVPLHLTRRLERGYNQALLLARAVAQAGPPRFVVRQVQRRVRATAPQGSPQGSTDSLDRRTNVRGAFAHSRPARWSTASVRGRSVWLVDDVWTSGATLEECAQVLRSIGAKRVQALVLARAAHRVP